jgi:hypothetical protein
VPYQVKANGPVRGRVSVARQWGLSADAHRRNLGPKTVQCLSKDPHALLAFYDSPSRALEHLRGERRLETGRAPPQALSRRTAGSTQAQINVCVVIGGPRPRQDTLITPDPPG